MVRLPFKQELAFKAAGILAAGFIAALSFAGCSERIDEGSEASFSQPVAAYCPYLPSRAFSPSITFSGKAYYEYRVGGNGPVANGSLSIAKAGGLSGPQTYSLSVNGVAFSVTGSLSSSEVVNNLKAQILASPPVASKVSVTGSVSLGLSPKNGAAVVSIENVSSSLVVNGANPRPIRFAEVRVTSSAGQLVQCGETDANGSFSLALPRDGASYKISVASRANNAKNSAYVLNSPSVNDFYTVSVDVVASTVETAISGLVIKAPATSSLEGGAFNILDQILNAQEYLRTKTADCDKPGTPSYFPDCTPFTVAPLVSVYWAPGVSPGVYVGQSGAISYYVNGKRELYILGGLNGDTTTADMDHFDDSVIIHEYGHFIEDQFGRPNSPGGSHNGNSIIDPRLAWGEGWANFFQAAVTGQPYYRDTYGTADCPQPSSGRPCTGVNFNESLDNPASDIPSGTGGVGEGNFREFSVARVLWNAIKSSPSLLSPFAELWTVFAGQHEGMRAIDDPFKFIGRFHAIQRAVAGHADWSSIRSTEQQSGDLSSYATPFTLTTQAACTSSPVTMNVRRSYRDDGSFATADQFRNSDFYVYRHPGGNLAVAVELVSSDGPVDLDLYLLKNDYVFGDQSSWLRASNGDGSNESFSITAPAGTYMIHVMAYTGIYSGVASQTLGYRLTLNGATICPGK